MPDPKLSTISYTTAKHKATPHKQAIAEITAAIHGAVTHNLNYDHVNVSIPKQKVPLWIQGRRFDIAYRKAGYLVLIDVFAFEDDEIEIMEREDGKS